MAGTAHPMLGYPTARAARLALRKTGLHWSDADVMIGWKKPVDNRVNVSPDTLELLEPHAKRRGISVRELARQILFAAADDDMIDGILDDR